MIRRDVFDYVLALYRSAEIVQRNVRRYLLRKRFLFYLHNRVSAVGILQRNLRRWMAYRRAWRLRCQQSSPWEQLWDSRYNRLYYFNVETQESTYEEPTDGVYRPLIREKHSAALIQAWPSLRPSAMGAQPLATLPMSVRRTLGC